MSAGVATTSASPRQRLLQATLRLWHALVQFRQKSTRERADLVLFGVGLAVEYVLLLAVAIQYARQSEIANFNIVVMVALFFALGVHQFLIFRNSTLQYALPGARARFLELIICLLFGVITGEIGYLLVLVCSTPTLLLGLPPYGGLFAGALLILLAALLKILVEREAAKPLLSGRACATIVAFLIAVAGIAFYLDRDFFAIRPSTGKLQWFFARAAFDADATSARLHGNSVEFAVAAVEWFAGALGRALESVFSCGAAILSALIFLWDCTAGKSFRKSAEVATEPKDREIRSRSYGRTMWFFFCMDGVSIFTWVLVLGVVLPRGIVLPYHYVITSHACFLYLCALSLIYAVGALVRLGFAMNTVSELSDAAVAAETVL